VIHLKPQIVPHVISFAISATAGILAIIVDESIGFSLGVIFVFFGGVWWLGRKLQSLEDRLDQAQEWRLEVKEHLDRNDKERLALYNFVKANKDIADLRKGDTERFKKNL